MIRFPKPHVLNTPPGQRLLYAHPPGVKTWGFSFGEAMRVFFWRVVLEQIKRRYIGKKSKMASQVVDCCTYTQEAIK